MRFRFGIRLGFTFRGQAKSQFRPNSIPPMGLRGKRFLTWRARFHLRGRPGLPAPPLHPRIGPLGRRGARAAAPPWAARGRNPLLDGTSGTLP